MIQNDIIQALGSGRVAALVLLDFSAAFDTPSSSNDWNMAFLAMLCYGWHRTYASDANKSSSLKMLRLMYHKDMTSHRDRLLAQNFIHFTHVHNYMSLSWIVTVKNVQQQLPGWTIAPETFVLGWQETCSSWMTRRRKWSCSHSSTDLSHYLTLPLR